MADDDVMVAKNKRTLLEKYDIPVNHLTFEYVQECNSGKELECIIKILRSGEEGLYPDLEKCATNRLKEIMPNSRVLLTEEPVLTKSMLDAEHWNQVNNDLANWSSEMKTKEQDLKSGEDSFVTVDMPSIRSGSNKTNKSISVENKTTDKKIKSILPKNYSEWDKYDADKEILKMDLEEDKRKEELERIQRRNEKEEAKVPCASRPRIVDSAGFSKTEKQFLATQEKDKGNEYFKSLDYRQAIEHYSTSIAIYPTAVAYNNRAMAYIRLNEYPEALKDSNKALELEPGNVKALHRRGTALKNLGDLQNALEDFIRIMQLEPSNRAASSLVLEVQKKIDSNRRTVRMHITEEESIEDGRQIIELPDYDINERCIDDPSTVNNSWPGPFETDIEYNEFGLPKVMCDCCGVPDWVRRPPPRCLVCKEIKEKRKAQKLKEIEANSKDSETEDYRSEEEEPHEESVCEHDVSHPASETITPLSRNEASLPSSNFEAAVINEETPVLEEISHPETAKNAGDFTCKEEASVSKAASNKSSVASSSKVKSGRKMEARCLMPTESIKPVKVQVASKYTTKSVLKGEEETTCGVQAMLGLSLEDETTKKIATPYEFLNALQAAKGDSILLLPVLRRVEPSNLRHLIGNKLDDIMLRSILECLWKYFIQNGPLVQKFLENLADLPRFKIVKMFLDSETKQVIQELLESLMKQNCDLPSHLLENYKF